jgi:cytochrome c biogenesis protein CcmG, thiol:disulfide interchange protein DsbE
VSRPLRIVLALTPLVILAGLIAVFALSLNRDPGLIQSVLIDKPAPQFDLPAVEGTGVPGFDTAALVGEVTVVNVFASWCIPCRDEHPVLEELKRQTGVRLFGMNQKDEPRNVGAFLAELGNPFAAIGGDFNGRTSIDWGVYGVPETFIVDAKGIIRFKHIGPLTLDDLASEIIPAIAKAKATAPDPQA